MIAIIIILIVGLFLNNNELSQQDLFINKYPQQDLFVIHNELPKQENLLYMRNDCPEYWQEQRKKNLPRNALDCYSLTILKKQINDSIWIIQENFLDSTDFTTYKKVDSKILFKNKFNPKYTLFFDFKRLKAGECIMYPLGKTEPMYAKYKIAFLKKIKLRGEYLYQIEYEPVGFFSMGEQKKYYYNEKGECVIIELRNGATLTDGFYLRTDYFDKALIINKEIDAFGKWLQ